MALVGKVPRSRVAGSTEVGRLEASTALAGLMAPEELELGLKLGVMRAEVSIVKFPSFKLNAESSMVWI